ncbi:hypothetical protein RhiirC2_853612 [Rhizophagus irregularis]|uniref:Uncharacterized protein n=1 Tax=Rhizophagus irregularis TaxID=588596 RepID=A0A2N1MUT3_9GLOM|nr:hypothetical protein RhiirC2_853612 [Rhizophagus irregularis]
MWLSTHTHNGEAVRRIIIEQNKFIKFISYDLVVCPYIALVCIGTHNHPSSPPERTPLLEIVLTIKATFDKDELHNMHPYGQGNLGVLYNVQCKKFDMHNYVRCIVKQIEDGQILIICMLNFQAKEFQKLKCLHINEFEVNTYDDDTHNLTNAYQRLFTQLFEVVENLSGNLIAKKFEVYQLELSIPSILSAEEVYNCLKKLETYNDNRIMGRHLDVKVFKIAETHDRYGVPYTRRNKSEIKRQTRAMTRENGKQKKYSKNQKQSRKARKKGSKIMKGSNKQKYKIKKSRVDIIEINSDQENEDQDIMLNIEIEERKMQLIERRTADRKLQAEIEKLRKELSL